MLRQHASIFSPAIGRALELCKYGHGGMPVLVFPSSQGRWWDYENFHMVEWLTGLIEAGRLRLYCVDSFDSESWYAHHLPLHERAARHALYEDWIVNHVMPAIERDVGDDRQWGGRLLATGCSFGAYHAANFTLKHPRKFFHALCLSGVYDIRFLMHNHHDDSVYFNNPIEYVSNMHGAGGPLDEVRRNVFITLVCGQGQWEEPCLNSTRQFWWLLREKGIPNYMDLWGYDVAHDWPWWRKQIVHYLSLFAEGMTPW